MQIKTNSQVHESVQLLTFKHFHLLFVLFLDIKLPPRTETTE